MQATTDILKDIRVLDLSRVMSGPYCTAMLADLGAEVIKIELPKRGDEGRLFGPHKDGESTYFMLLNRGKKSITVDLKHPEGVALIKRLAAKCDVVVENFRPGVAKRLGLDYEAIRAENERVVYASISGFGQDGPLADLPAFDLVIQAMSGLMSITGQKGGPATAVGESVADICTGMFAAWGIMAALYSRERTGRGQHLDVAMLDSMFAMQLTALSRLLYFGGAPTRVGNRHPETYPVDSFPTRTGDVVMVVPSNPAFAQLAAAMGQPGLAKDPRFVDNVARNRNEDALRAIISAWTEARTADEVVDALGAVSIPAAAVWTLDRVVSSGHEKHRTLVKKGRHVRFGEVPLVPQPVRFSDGAVSEVGAPPVLGQHTDEVLKELLALDDAAISALRAKGVIGSEGTT
jgi:CoA:oxalate CoA-transferase